MWPVVEAAFPAWSAHFEGRVPHMYLDREGYVTTGVGNKIDPLSEAFALPWRRADGAYATRDEVTREWLFIQGHQDRKDMGGEAGFRDLASLTISDAVIDNLVRTRLRQNAAALLARFPGFEAWPADAQLAALSMAWAMGAARFDEFPRFSAAARAEDFETAASESHMVGVGIDARNAANEALFRNAARVVREGLPRDQFVGDVAPTNTIPTVTITGNEDGGGGGGLGGAVMLLVVLGGVLFFATRS